MTLSYQQREFKLQVAAVTHVRSAFPGLEFLHIPNRPGSAADGYFKKLLGAKPGASDLLFTWNYTHLQGGLIELKTDDGKLSNDQNRFLSSWSRLGWQWAVCKSVKSVHAALCQWGHAPSHNYIVEPNYQTWDEKVKSAFEFYFP